MFGLITKSKIKRLLIQLESVDRRGMTGDRVHDMYYGQGVGNAVSYICWKLGIRYEEVLNAANEEGIKYAENEIQEPTKGKLCCAAERSKEPVDARPDTHGR